MKSLHRHRLSWIELEFYIWLMFEMNFATTVNSINVINFSYAVAKRFKEGDI